MSTLTAPAFTPVRCGNRDAHGDTPTYHNGTVEVRGCYAWTRTEREMADDDSRAEMAYERHLEDRGYDEARAQDDYEARHGVVGFIEAWHNESPDTCPCCH